MPTSHPKPAQRIERLLQEGLELYGAGKEEAAIERWREVLELDPGNETALDFLTDAGAELVDEPPAAPTPLRPVAATDDDPARQAIEAVRAGQLEAALELLYTAKQRHPEDKSVERAIRYVRNRLVLKLIEELGSLEQHVARELAPREALAQEATPEALHVLELAGGTPSLEDLVAASRLGRYTTLRTVRELVQRGWLTLHTPEATDASEAVSPAHEGSPNAPDTTFDELFAAATAAYVRRDLETAARLFRRCLELRPEDDRARHNYERIRKRLARRTEA